jgi:hypothetical protein
MDMCIGRAPLPLSRRVEPWKEWSTGRTWRTWNSPESGWCRSKSPWLWLGRGLADLLQTWPVSLAFGVVLAALGYLLATYAWTWPHLALALTSGLLLIALFMAVVFYDLSRQIDAGGRRAGVRHALTAWRDNAWSIGLYGALLMFLVIVWERSSAIVAALFLVGNAPRSRIFTVCYSAPANIWFFWSLTACRVCCSLPRCSHSASCRCQ